MRAFPNSLRAIFDLVTERSVFLASLMGVWLLATTAMSQDFVVTDGPLSDEDFYRLVSCRAEPGKSCVMDNVRWSPVIAQDLTLSIYETSPEYPHYDLASAALDQAITEINGAGAAVTLRRLEDGEDAHITIHLSGLSEGEPISGIGLHGVDGSTIYGAYVHIFWNGQKELTRGVIIMAKTLADFDIQPVLLEEITQGLGLLTDIRNPWYETRSVFSEDSNLVTKLGKQDLMTIRRHYPTQN